MIESRNISFKIPSGKKIIDDISLKIKPGKLTAVIGKNGAGKSTALRAICGDIHPSSGSIFVENEQLEKLNLADLARKRAVVTQKVTLDFSFTSHEVVSIGRSPYSGTFISAKDEEIVHNCLEKVDGLHLTNQSYTTLSGGEQQRIHLARALAQIWDCVEEEAPSYLLLDEPLASLDVSHQHEIMHLLKSLCDHNVGVLIVIHDLNLTAQYSDYVYILKNGQHVAEGTPNEVFTEEIIREAFDYPVSVIPHPKIECPLIVATGF